MSEEVISIYNAKTGFSQLITRVEAGERITISRHGRPVARFVPLAPERVRREPGIWRGQVESLIDSAAENETDTDTSTGTGTDTLTSADTDTGTTASSTDTHLIDHAVTATDANTAAAPAVTDTATATPTADDPTPTATPTTHHPYDWFGR